MDGRNLGILHSGIGDCDTMRMVSSCQFSRMEVCEPMRMVIACSHCEIEAEEAMRMISSYCFSRIADCETMPKPCHTYLWWPSGLGPFCAENLARPGTADRVQLEMAP